MKIDMTQFYQMFFEESGEHLREMERLLLAIDIARPDPDDLNAIFRAAHSIKGSGGTFGFEDMTAVTHVLETALDQLRCGEMSFSTELVDVMLEAVDVLKEQLAGHIDGAAVDAAPGAAICEKLEGVAARHRQPAAPTAAAGSGEEAYGFFDDPVPAPEAYGLFAEPPTAVSVSTVTARGDAQTRAAESSIRVSVEKVDQLVNLLGELVITQAMLEQCASGLGTEVYEALQLRLSQLERNTRDLQEAVMSIRMLPISFVFSRFPRMVRDLAAKLGKQVQLVTVGEATELDKGLIELLADPLTHLLRNSLDHGIETPEQRMRADKPARGVITLGAIHQGGNVIIEVSDDGAGLDRGRILAKARERGLECSDAWPDHKVWQLIFEPGFSTAETITDVSGRGVGMDVVRRNIAELGGTIDIESRLGDGTRISIRLPLTLAILDGMTVALGDDIYVIPLNAIIETLQPRAADLKSVVGGSQLIDVRGEYLPIIALHRLFNVEPREQDPTHGMLVVLESAGTKVALFVDALVGQQQVVIKSLESNYRKVPGLSGATIMGDGRVALILDVAALVKMDPHLASTGRNSQ